MVFEKITLDGVPFSGTFQDVERQALHMCITKDTLKQKVLPGFTTDQKLMDWGKQNKLDKRVMKGLKILKIAQKRAAKAPRDGSLEDVQLGKHQAKEISLARAKLSLAAKSHGVSVHKLMTEWPFKKVLELNKDYDIVLGRPLGSITLYNRTGCKGSWKYLRHGNYPNFKYFGFNDKTNAVRVWSRSAVLCRHSWWRGYHYWFYYPGDYCNLGWFKNRASSAAVF